MSKPLPDTRMSVTTPSMTWELESACHIMSKHVLRSHLDAKYGAGKWEIREFNRASDAEHGITVLSRELLAKNAVESGLVELRRQITEHGTVGDT